MIDRRACLVSLSLAVLGRPALGQARGRLPVVGFVGFATARADQSFLESFRSGLRALGHFDRASVVIEARSTDGDIGKGNRLIAELAAMPVDVFLSPGPAATRAIVRASSVPVVAIALPPKSSDHELYASLARPGGRVTGFSTYGEELSAKRIELLKEALPHAKSIGVLHNATDITFSAWGDQTIADAKTQGLEPMRLVLNSPSRDEVAAQIRRLRDSGGVALIVIRDFLTASLIDDICMLAAQSGIAVVGEQSEYPRAGALISYGPDIPDLFQRAAGYVDRILKGENAGDLPIQLPAKFELVVNLKTATALGLAIPPSILIRADEVIE